ncbi:MAG: SDR family oxidoreductase [Betaproteobacteria bacterium]|nr:SDR family oxidoreductase [Betaproteobacteria bacterium]
MSSAPNPCIIVTGASRGIGAAIAFALARDGYRVGCLSRSGAAPKGDGVDASVSHHWIMARCDVTDSASLKQAIAQVAGHGVTPMGLVNNAGVHMEGPSKEFSLAQFNEVMNTNATSVLLGSQAIYPYLEANHGGLIVNIGSFFDKLGVKRNLAYCASKAAVGAMTRCLAVEWASKHIRVLNVAPGYIQTDLNKVAMSAGPLRAYLEKRIPAGRPGTAMEVGELVAGLFKMPSPFLTGETLYFDGAQGIAH